MPTDLAMVSPDDQVTAEGENLVRAAINELRAMTVDAGTMELIWNGGTPCLRAFTQEPILEAKTGGAGIAAATSATQMSSGTVAAWACDSAGALSDANYTVTAWNKDTASAVAANAHVILAKNRAGLYVVIWEQCP